MLVQQPLEKNKNLAVNLVNQLRKQGFAVTEDGHLTFESYSKESIRKLHSIAVRHLLEKRKELIMKYDSEFLKFVANGSEVEPQKIEPVLIKVDKKKGDLFNWVKLHWSIPVSAGYGRRLRYIVMDRQNDKIIGIIGLGDPVYALKDREAFIGWTKEARSRNLKHIMDAFVLGSIPPYNMIMGGKLVASLVSSKEVYEDFFSKYCGTKSLISGRVFNGVLVGITTSSALGKSAVYDRIVVPNGTRYWHVGWTSGSGDFQFLNGYYDQLAALVKEHKYTGKNKKWGSGVRSRRAVIHKALSLLNLSPKFAYHGIKRELFFVPLGSNWKKFLCDESTELNNYNLSVEEISAFMKERWVIPRASRDDSYKKFERVSYSLMSSMLFRSLTSSK